MGNMSYCRFENTASDLHDCVSALGDMSQEGFDLSKDEIRGLKSLLRGMAEAMQIIGDTIGIDDVEDLAYLMADDQDKVVSQFKAACDDDAIPTVRGALMDELESRDQSAFDAWIDCENVEMMDRPILFFCKGK